MPVLTAGNRENVKKAFAINAAWAKRRKKDGCIYGRIDFVKCLDPYIYVG